MQEGFEMKKRKFAVVLIALLALALALFAVFSSNRPPKAAENEILLKIQLDLKEDIGLLLIDHSVNGNEGSGGMSNADRSMLGRDEVLYWSFEKQPGDPSETAELYLRFSVVTEYAAPNFDNIYPEETVIPLEPLSFSARYGEIVSIRIVGDDVNGFCAILE